MIILYILALVFPTGILLSGTLALLGYIRPQSTFGPMRFQLFSAFIGFFFTYFISLVLVFVNPYWIDNGSEEQIYFPQHFGWALLYSACLQWIVVPITMILEAFIRTRDSSD